MVEEMAVIPRSVVEMRTDPTVMTRNRVWMEVTVARSCRLS
nr:hypothetical protein JVH1_2356 [Rhodococcus sp. JVH1]